MRYVVDLVAIKGEAGITAVYVFPNVARRDSRVASRLSALIVAKGGSDDVERVEGDR